MNSSDFNEKIASEKAYQWNNELDQQKYQFGYDVLGPILVECCIVLYEYLRTNVSAHTPVLYCSRGGLLIRRALDLFLTQTGRTLDMPMADVMLSRLASARLALQLAPDDVEPMLELEFAGRSCAEVAIALTGKKIDLGDEWNQDYSLASLKHLLHQSAQGKRIHSEMLKQADLLREHILRVSGGSKKIVLVDTGVFGSIGHFLTVGLPNTEIQSVLLFKANYKAHAGLTLPKSEGLVCCDNDYVPWKARSVFRLYWPFIEAFFEPDLPSVKRYRFTPEGEVSSNLQVPNWQNLLITPGNPLRLGAFDYLGTIGSYSADSRRYYASVAWKNLKRRIVFPSKQDVNILKVDQRCVDFGFEEYFSVGLCTANVKLVDKLNSVRNSMWPEGEIRSEFGFSAMVWLSLLEASRIVKCILRF